MSLEETEAAPRFSQLRFLDVGRLKSNTSFGSTSLALSLLGRGKMNQAFAPLLKDSGRKVKNAGQRPSKSKGLASPHLGFRLKHSRALDDSNVLLPPQFALTLRALYWSRRTTLFFFSRRSCELQAGAGALHNLPEPACHLTPSLGPRQSLFSSQEQRASCSSVRHRFRLDGQLRQPPAIKCVNCTTETHLFSA